ncbi:MAG: hypothetical protein ACRDHN_07355, partial [Thermomicrobiales bacterium]
RDLYSKEGYFRKMLRDDLFDRKLTDRLVDIATEGRGAVINGFVEPDPVVADDGAPEIIEAVGTVADTAEAPMGLAAAPQSESSNDTVPTGAVAGTGESDCIAGYPIKGNASSKIYHVAGQSSYDQTIPELCFATEEDAVAAGYRASKSAIKASSAETDEA